MSNLIHLLPDAIANQIAAGEVIQRPASVVKELVENGIDSGADEIELIVKDAGKSLIQVIDNGCGMSETDARMSLERHATSKLTSADDLFALRTMGFRGEALASIVAIAQMEMKTRRGPDDLGTRLLVEGTEIKAQEPVATPPGTSIAVRNLFYNVPARRNFLKSDSVELRHIRDEFIRIALAHPHIRFDLHVNDRLDLSLPAGKLRHRIVNIFGKKYQEMLVPIEEQTDILRIGGYVGKPEAARKSKVGQFFFINNRFIRSGYLHHAVMAAYDELLPKDSHPFYAITLDIDPARIDVNVHPTKQEIKFEDERIIYNYLKATIRHGLGRASIMPTIDFETDNPFHSSRVSMRSSPVLDQGAALPSKMNEGVDRGSGKDGGSNRDRDRSTGRTDDGSSNDAAAYEARRQANNLRNWEMMYRGLGEDGTEKEGELIASKMGSEESTDESVQPAERAPYQLHQRYIISSIQSGWLLIDQQSAHERILYEQFLGQLADKPATTQTSMFPETIELPAADYAMAVELLPDLKALGFDLEPFGGNSLLLRGIPAELAGQHNDRALLEKLLDAYRNDRDMEHGGQQRLARSLARSGSIRRGQSLDVAEMRSLMDRLFACTQPATAPNGRRCFVKVELDEVERRFEI